MLDDFDYLTGFTVAPEWQRTRSPMPLGHRLLPRVPFIAGGEFAVDNMVLVTDAERMAYGARLATHVARLQDGEAVRLPYELDNPTHPR